MSTAALLLADNVGTITPGDEPLTLPKVAAIAMYREIGMVGGWINRIRRRKSLWFSSSTSSERRFASACLI